MKSNGLLKWLVVPILVLVVWLLIKSWASHHVTRTNAPTTDTLTPAEMKALGIEGDTPRDTVATLVGQVKALRNEMQTAIHDNQTQRAENERLRQHEGDIDQRIQNAINAERDRSHGEREQADSDKQQTQGLLQDVERRLDSLDRKNTADLPIGLGLRDGDGAGLAGGDTQWTEPADKTPQGNKRGTSNATPSTSSIGGFGPASNSTTPTSPTGDTGGMTAAEDGSTGKSRLRPVYTVPANATLIGSIAMTALIGRVPIDGTVNDPYPFKVLIGPDNLTANGIDLPDVAGAVVSGTASGDWTLSCVRGQIRSITFVFRDGTIRTLPASDRGSNSDASNNAGTTNNTTNGTATTQGGLGWISDPYGIPCVAGERRSNAEQYLGSEALITAAGAGAASLIPKGSDNVSYVSSNGNTLGTVGISANEAMGRILAGGVQEMSQWVNKLYGQAFAAIYVKPGAKVAVHIDQPLTLDYDPKGRKVNYRTGGTHAPDLD